MSTARSLSALALCLGITWMTGCCGPWACAPSDCGPNACGPVLLGDGCGKCDGCGELYVDPWINHPPDCCDPCDTCGNYNGQSCGKCRSVFAGVRTLWGYRCDDGSCTSGGCDGGACDASCGCDQVSCGSEQPCGPSCGGCDACAGHDASCGLETSCGLELLPGEAISATPMEPAPTVGNGVVRVLPSPSSTTVGPNRRSCPSDIPYPQDIPRIFKARPHVAVGEADPGSF